MPDLTYGRGWRHIKHRRCAAQIANSKHLSLVGLAACVRILALSDLDNFAPLYTQATKYFAKLLRCDYEWLRRPG